jgi:hypothetical protein
MKHKYLYLTVSVSGASVLAVEILGTRILGPFYGVSLFLWSALITVTLAALSAGYVLGGRWADKGATYARLSSLLAGAGAWLLLVPWIRSPLLSIAEPFGLRLAALVAALVLFFVPLMLLGMVSPYAIKLRASSLEEIGRSAGNLYAISTAASVAAALVTGFFLIPNVGVYRLTLAMRTSRRRSPDFSGNARRPRSSLSPRPFSRRERRSRRRTPRTDRTRHEVSFSGTRAHTGKSGSSTKRTIVTSSSTAGSIRRSIRRFCGNRRCSTSTSSISPGISSKRREES